MKKDLEGLEDVKILVDNFYLKATENSLIGPIFNKWVADWPAHLEIMYSFWFTILFGKASYHGNPFIKHMPLLLEKEHFQTWIKLFEENIDFYFEGPIATDAKEKANKIAEMFQIKLSRLKDVNPDLI